MSMIWAFFNNFLFIGFLFLVKDYQRTMISLSGKLTVKAHKEEWTGFHCADIFPLAYGPWTISVGGSLFLR